MVTLPQPTRHVNCEVAFYFCAFELSGEIGFLRLVRLPRSNARSAQLRQNEPAPIFGKQIAEGDGRGPDECRNKEVCENSSSLGNEP